MQQWIELLSTLTLYEGQEQDLRTDEQLHAFEESRGIILPNEYKGFCKVFGSGVFGYFLTIYCPEVEQIDIEYLKEELNDSKDIEGSEFAYRLRHGETVSDINLIQEILDSAFIFGFTSGGELIFWDLRTYSKADDNYDIYMTRVKDFPGIYQIGRSFFEFIETYGLGIRPYDFLPEWTHPSIQELNGTFYPFKVCE